MIQKVIDKLLWDCYNNFQNMCSLVHYSSVVKVLIGGVVYEQDGFIHFSR